MPRSTLYYQPKLLREAALRIMARIVAPYLKDHCSAAAGWWAAWPEMGSQSAESAYATSCNATAYGQSISTPAPPFPGDPSERHPCMVDLDQLTAVDQVWATVITTIPLQMGFLYLVAIMDLFTRHVFSMEAELPMEPTLRPHPIPPTSELMMQRG